MAVPTVNIVIEQDADFSTTYSLKRGDGSPLDLTGYSFSAAMKKWSESSGRVSFATTFTGSPQTGKLTISLTSVQTGIITAGRYNYDILVTNVLSNITTKVITGQALVNGTVL
jgi:hypothetical protein